MNVPRLTCLALLVCLLPPPAAAAPVVGVSPSTLDRFDQSAVHVSATGLTGAVARVRLFVDVNADGTLDPPDWLVWADLVPDNVTEWSPVPFVDIDPAAGAVAIDARAFGPFGFPYTPGSYLWQVEDSANGTKGTAAFTVTQAVEPQSASGLVTDGSLNPLGGALVVLEPVSENCDERALSTFSDAAGNWSIEVPDDLPCNHRLALALRPGHVSSYFEAVPLEFGGSGAQAGIMLVTRPGTHAVSGSLRYDNGPRAGQGVPGVPVLVDSEDGRISLAITAIGGAYSWMLEDGNWYGVLESELALALQGTVASEGTGQEFTVAGAAVALADRRVPAANAFVRGTVRDANGTGQAALEITASSTWPCETDCFETAGISAPDGSFVLALVAPSAPATASFEIDPSVPLDGLLARVLTIDLSAGDDLPGQDLEHLPPSSLITGSFTDLEGNPLPDLCVWAYSQGPDRLVARARTGCDGSYALPVIDGEWSVSFEEEDAVGFIRNIDGTRVESQLTVTGGDLTLDRILGPFGLAPAIRQLEPLSGPTGAHVAIQGSNFGSSPVVIFGGIPAPVLAVRPDIGRVVVEVPAGLPPGTAEVTVTDTSSGLTSPAGCFTVLGGSFTAACSISGNLTFGTGSAMADALIVVLDEQGEAIRRAAVSDGTGDYTVDLDSSGPHTLLFISPASNPREWGVADGVACPAVVDHAFLTGRRLSGKVVDFSGEGIPHVVVEAEGLASFAEGVTDENGDFDLRLKFNDTVQVSMAPPQGSRWFGHAESGPIEMTAAIDLPPTTLESGDLFIGRVVDRFGNGRQTWVRAFGRYSGTLAGETLSGSCDGAFAVAVGFDDHELRLEPPAQQTYTSVQWVAPSGDERAEFDFTIFDAALLQYPGPEPRIGDEPTTRGQVGQVVIIDAENLTAEGVSVLFTAGAAGAPGGIPGDDTVWDPVRGLVLTRVPVGAATGDLVLEVQGVPSEPLPFTVEDGTFDTGGITLSGQVFEGVTPVEGAVVVLLRLTPSDLYCDADDELHDYAITDATGSFALVHPGGDVGVLVLPPRTLPPTKGSVPSTTLAPAFSFFPGEMTDRVLDVFLEQGLPLTLRVVAGDPPEPVPGALVQMDSEAGFDQARTDALGEATLFATPGDLEVRVLAPVGSRLQFEELFVMAPVDLGDVPLSPGLFVSGRVVDEAANPIAGVRANAYYRGPGPFENYFQTISRENGLWRGPVPQFTPVGVTLNSERIDVSDADVPYDNGISWDTIGYPSIVLGPAGLIRGSVLDGSSGMPQAQIGINGHFDAGGQIGGNSGFAQTCDDGSFSMKLAEGAHYVSAVPFFFKGAGGYYDGWYSPATVGDSCPLDAEVVDVTAGLVVYDVDIEIDPFSGISGTVETQNGGESGVFVSASVGRLGTCSVGGFTAEGGGYQLMVPAGPGYRVEAQAPSSVGGPPHCWDGQAGCADYTPVDTTPFSTTTGIDFLFAAIPPPEISATSPLLTVAISGLDVTLTFEKLPPELPAFYNIYTGVLGSFGTAATTLCYLDPAGFLDNLDGTYSHTFVPVEPAQWFLVSASNASGESSIGLSQALSNACGAVP